MIVSISAFAIWLLVLCCLDPAEGYGTGAPAESCSTLRPNPYAHGAPIQTSEVPYGVDLSDFDDGEGNLSYIPGQTYSLKVSSPYGLPFRGVILQGRSANDDSVLGLFINTDPSTRLSDCSPPESAVTHNDPSDKTGVSTMWTAPAVGSGPIEFGFAVVKVRKEYWGDLRTETVEEQEMVDCGKPPNPVNGRVVLSGTTQGSTAQYYCVAGYAFKGVDTRMCGNDGKWTNDEPTCEGESVIAMILRLEKQIKRERKRQ